MALSGDVKCLIQANNGDVLAGTNNSARIYRSTDNGQNWTQIVALGSSSDSVNAFARNKSNGYLYAALTGAAGVQGIWRSVDNGANWTRVKAHPSNIGYYDLSIFQESSGVVAVGGPTASDQSPVVWSGNHGSTWQNLSPRYWQSHIAAASPIESVLYSQYPGENPIGTPSIQHFLGVDSYYTEQWGVRAPAFSGATPAIAGISTTGGGAGNGGLDMAAFIFKDATNVFRRRALWAVKSHLNTADTEIWQWPVSASGPFTFAKIVTISGKNFNVLYVDPVFDWQNIGADRTIWAGADGEIWVSYNSGLAWAVATDAPSGEIYSFIRTTDGVLIAGGESGEIFIFGSGSGSEGGGSGGDGGGDDGGGGETPPVSAIPTSKTLGRSATCDDEVFVANKFAFSQITHAFYYNGSAYDNLQFEDDPPYALFGSSAPATGRILYLGSLSGDANVPGGPFSGAVFDISDIANDITLTWEYWNGSAWTTLTVQDGTDNFKLPGVNSVHWRVPSNWDTTSVDSVTAYWVRARISAVGSSPEGPTQANRYIYTPSLPYFEVASGEVSGDLPALGRIYWRNRAETAAAILGTKIDRLVCGLKSVEKGINFNAYLNISDIQTPFGMSLAIGTGAAWGDAITAPTGRALTVSYSSGGDTNVWNDLVTFTLSNTIARSFYGSYRVFVRCSKAGANADWQIRAKTSFGSGGGSSFSQVRFPTPSGTWEILDLGQMAIPTIQVAQQTTTAQQITITLQGNASATSSAMTFYDLILIPVDEWAVDAKSPELSTSNSAKVVGGQYLDIDSVSSPKNLISAMNRNAASQIISQFHAINNGPVILQAGQQQRFWFLVMNYNTYWTSVPEAAGSVQVFKKQRYLGLRGID